MKPSKTFGLVVLGALISMAFVGASSVMAEETTPCQVDENPCSEGHEITHIHLSTLAGHKLVINTNVLTVECDALGLGEVLKLTKELSGLILIHTQATYTNCNSGNCTVSEENGPSKIEVLKEGHETASVVDEVLLHISCSGLNCRYKGAGLKGTVKGPLLSTESNGEGSLVKQSLSKESGLFCPSTSELTVAATPLEPAYITS